MLRNKKALRKFGAQITAIRQQKKITVGELAIASGLEPAHIGRIEAGEINLLLTTILALAKGLGIEPAKLLETL
jgi:transcriptional regulator with XRE-family HTH domain